MSHPVSTARGRGAQSHGGLGARLGIWIGFSAWWIALALVTIPHAGVFAWAIVGAAILSSFLAWLVTRQLVPPVPVARVLGTVLLCGGLLLAYYSLAIQSRFDVVPEVEERLRALGSVTRVPWGVGAMIAGTGTLVLAWHARRGR